MPHIFRKTLFYQVNYIADKLSFAEICSDYKCPFAIGLVNSEMRSEYTNFGLRLHDDLERERQTHKNAIPTAWILAKFRQIGLEAYVHNFTLNYPLGGGRTFSGKNVYGILRASRIGSTEAIVISTPYRPPESIHTIVMPSLPILIAFASFARSLYL